MRQFHRHVGQREVVNKMTTPMLDSQDRSAGPSDQVEVHHWRHRVRDLLDKLKTRRDKLAEHAVVFDLQSNRDDSSHRREDSFRDDIGPVAGRVAAGFTLLVGFLTFFGIKDGALDQLLRTRPGPALWVFVLVGAGVALGVLAPAFHPNASVLFWAPVTVALLAAIVTSVVLHSAHANGGGWVTTVTGLCVAAAFILAVILHPDSRIPAAAGVMLLGLALLGTGIYGAARLSVLTKAFAGTPSLTVTLTGEPNRTVTVAVHAVGRDAGDRGVIRVEVRGLDEGAATVLGAATLVADASGTIAAAPAFAIDASTYPRFDVVSCAIHNGNCESRDLVEAYAFSGTGGASQPVLIGSIQPAPGAGRLQVLAQLRGSAHGATARLNVERCHGPCAVVASFIVAADDDPKTLASLQVITGTRGDEFRLVTTEPRKTIATYSVP